MTKIQNKNPKKDYRMIKKLGQGTFGIVYLAENKATDEQVAIKQVKKAQLGADLTDWKLEMKLLLTLDHPNIIRLFEVYDYKSYMYLITEPCRGGQLFQEIKKKGKLTESETALIMEQLIGAINNVHNKKICHRDLKPENILLKEPGNYNSIKIIDFGLSRYCGKEEVMTAQMGTPYYIAPEVLDGKYDKKCDLWSLGVILYILLSGKAPFYGNTNNEIYGRI